MTPVDLWRQIQRENFTKWGDLCAFLKLDPIQQEWIKKKSSFPLNLPRRLAEKIKKGTLEDPIFKQFVPTIQEDEKKEGFSCNPVGDEEVQRGKYLQKYEGRVLLLVTSGCAMHCRYCFRQHFPYQTLSGFEEELGLIREDTSLKEVILSGGDPLSLRNEVLATLMRQIEEIPHIKRVRFHTRFPIGIPERIDEGFLAILASTSLQVWFVIHANLAQELDEEVLFSLKQVQKLAIPVISHTVLLRGVNDSVSLLQELFEKMVDHGIQPYYLFQLDRVEGAAHFETSEEEGHLLMEALRKRLSGYAIPRYAKEVAGLPSKLIL